MGDHIKVSEWRTPGPWKVEFPQDARKPAIVSSARGVVARVTLNGSDARLIAAAPDLHEALAGLVEHFAFVMAGPMVSGSGVTFANGVEGIPTIKMARAALAKARGETP